MCTPGAYPFEIVSFKTLKVQLIFPIACEPCATLWVKKSIHIRTTIEICDLNQCLFTYYHVLYANNFFHVEVMVEYKNLIWKRKKMPASIVFISYIHVHGNTLWT